MYDFFGDPEWDLFWGNNAYGFIYPEEPPMPKPKLSVDEVRRQARKNKEESEHGNTIIDVPNLAEE